MKEWREIAFANRPGHCSLFKQNVNQLTGESDSKTVLVLDSWKPHQNVNFIKEMEESHGTKIAMVPGGMTTPAGGHFMETSNQK
jgi:hypothetical protein